MNPISAHALAKVGTGTVVLLMGIAPVLANNWGQSGEGLWVPSVVQENATAKHNTPLTLKSQTSAEPVLTVELDAPGADEIQRLKNDDGSKKRHMIGIGREIPQPWANDLDLRGLRKAHLVSGAHVSEFAIRSSHAEALRVQLLIVEFPKGAELRFYAPNDTEATGLVFTASYLNSVRRSLERAGELDADQPLPIWSPVIDGEVIAVEIFTPPEVDPDHIRIGAPRVSHLLASPIQGSLDLNLEKHEADIGLAGSCNIPVACAQDLPDLIRNAVAKYLLTDSSGQTGACSGTLLASSPHNGIPYFMTARHCVASHSETASMDFYWFFEITNCGGNQYSIAQQSGGADLLATGGDDDFTFVKLRTDPPNGVTFAGWTTNPGQVGAAAHGVHHPRGDLKAYSLGSVQGFPSFSVAGIRLTSSIEVQWSNGTTEPGSSGSGLFGSNDNSYFFVGTLSGGSASCASQSAPDYYGRFHRQYDAVSSFLVNDTPPSTGNSRLLNLSTNGFVPSNGMQAGMIVTGSGAKTFAFLLEPPPGSASPLNDPVLQITTFPDGVEVARNDDWRDHPSANELVSRLGREPYTNLSSGLVTTLPVGAYIAVAEGVDGSTGRALVSVQDLDTADNPKLLNLSTQGVVSSSGMQAGFIVTGSGTKRFVIFAENLGGADALTDPVMELETFPGGRIIDSNDDWGDHRTADEVVAEARTPYTDRSSALIATLAPGAYVVDVKGFQGATGRALVSVMELE